VSLSLIKNSAVVGNALDAGGKRLYVITGANQGGKSTFLRSMGQAQLMAQRGRVGGADGAAPDGRPGGGIHAALRRPGDLCSL